MTTETKDQLKETVAAVRAFTETFKEKEHMPLKEEVERLSAQLTESMRASKRAALLRQVESTTQGTRILSGKYRGFDEFDLMLSRAVLRIAERGGVDGRRPVDPRTAAEWRSNLEGARADLYESIGRALDSDTPGAGDELTFTGETSEMWRNAVTSSSSNSWISLWTWLRTQSSNCSHSGLDSDLLSVLSFLMGGLSPLLGLEPVLFREKVHRLTVYTLFEDTSMSLAAITIRWALSSSDFRTSVRVTSCRCATSLSVMRRSS